MKTPRLLVPGLLCLLLVGCVTTSSGPDTSAGSIMKRIDANRAAFDSWPIQVQNAIFDGKAIKGMNAEQVRMALGEPLEVLARGQDEVWVYKRGEEGDTGSGGGGLLRGTTVGMSSGGGVYIGGSRSTPSVPVGTPAPAGASVDDEVVFRRGIVIRAPGQK